MLQDDSKIFSQCSVLVVQKKAFANTGKVIDLFAAMREVIYAQFGSKQVNVVHAYLYI